MRMERKKKRVLEDDVEIFTRLLETLVLDDVRMLREIIENATSNCTAGGIHSSSSVGRSLTVKNV